MELSVRNYATNPLPASPSLSNANPPAAEQLKDVIQDFYRVMVQVSTYDSMGVSSKEVLSKEM